MSKRAFTLIELLLVVIVIFILATVAIPKYKRVLENNRTAEAEKILNAVRTEQEARCIAGKNYLGEDRRADLASLKGVGVSQNYKYNLMPGAIEAQRSDKYALKMWYKTGEVCCSGPGCSTLNKNYPLCTEDMADECTASDVPAPPLPPNPEPPSCGPQPTTLPAPKTCNTCGVQTPSYVCNESTNWSWETTWSECSAPPKPTAVTLPSCGKCGTRPLICDPETASWIVDNNSCVNEVGVCTPGEMEIVGCDTMSSPSFPPAGTSQYTGSDLIPAITVRKCAADGCSWEYPVECACPLCSQKTNDGHCLMDKMWFLTKKIVKDCQCDAQGHFINRDESTHDKISQGSTCDTLGQTEIVKYNDNCGHLPVSGGCTGKINYDQYSCGRKCSDSNGKLWSYQFPGHGSLTFNNGELLWDHTDFFK